MKLRRNLELLTRFALVLLLLFFAPKVLLKPADLIQIRANSIEHFPPLAKDLLNIWMSCGGLGLSVRIHSWNYDWLVGKSRQEIEGRSDPHNR